MGRVDCAVVMLSLAVDCLSLQHNPVQKGKERDTAQKQPMYVSLGARLIMQ